MVPASLFYRHKEGRGTCTGRSKVVVFSLNRGRAVGDYCRKYIVGALKSMVPGVAVVLGVILGLAEIMVAPAEGTVPCAWCDGVSRVLQRARAALEQKEQALEAKESELQHKDTELQREKATVATLTTTSERRMWPSVRRKLWQSKFSGVKNKIFVLI